MIVQRVKSRETPIIIRNVDHAETAEALARHFGNEEFAAPEPSELMAFLTRHHEEGWREIDDNPALNPETGLPFHLAETPMPLLLQKSAASPDFNELHHPWCGLLSSMHSWGLFHDRYGLSEKVSIKARPSGFIDQIEHMLAGELSRQKRLTELLRADPHAAQWAEASSIMSAYKLLEFFDMLALHFQMSGAGLRVDSIIPSVPAGYGLSDRTLQLHMTGPASARLTPYPFAASPLPVVCRARRLMPSRNRSEMIEKLRTQPFEIQIYTLCA